VIFQRTSLKSTLGNDTSEAMHRRAVTAGIIASRPMAAHESPRTTKLYDRTKERLTQDEVERINL
jgi:hypothetical protein